MGKVKKVKNYLKEFTFWGRRYDVYVFLLFLKEMLYFFLLFLYFFGQESNHFRGQETLKICKVQNSINFEKKKEVHMQNPLFYGETMVKLW